eukprot:2963048-Karenia_brevis.AAC.1
MGSSATEPRAKRVGVKTREDAKQEEEMLKMMQVLGKAVLANRQAIKTVQAVTIMSFQLPTDHQIVQEVKGGVQAFLKAQQSMKDKGESQDAIRQALGTPTVHSTNAVIKWVLEQLKDTPQGKKMAEAVKTWKSWEMLLEHVPHIKVNKQFQGHLKKLEICLPL